MELKKEFIMRNIAGDYILVPVGKTALEFNGLITINDIGAFIWRNLNTVTTEEEILDKILNEYEVDEVTAKEDLEEFLSLLRKVEII